MPSKYCLKCGRVISSNFAPNYCVFGCGSLENQPVIPEFRTLDERQEYIRFIEEQRENIFKALAIDPEQLTLFR